MLDGIRFKQTGKLAVVITTSIFVRLANSIKKSVNLEDLPLVVPAHSGRGLGSPRRLHELHRLARFYLKTLIPPQQKIAFCDFSHVASSSIISSKLPFPESTLYACSRAVIKHLNASRDVH